MTWSNPLETYPSDGEHERGVSGVAGLTEHEEDEDNAVNPKLRDSNGWQHMEEDVEAELVTWTGHP